VRFLKKIIGTFWRSLFVFVIPLIIYLLFGAGIVPLLQQVLPEDEVSSHADFRVEDLVMRTTDWTVQVEGTIRNYGKIPVAFIKLKYLYQDEDGNTIDTDWNYAVGSLPLLPGESKRFTKIQPKPPGLRKVRVEVIDYRYE